jgi:outer membrane protein assembly factor BamA
MIEVKGFIVIFFLGVFLNHGYGQETGVLPEHQLVINNIVITGNNVTKENILLREMVFSKGDTIEKMQLIPAFEKSRENLLNLSLFNFVTLDTKHYPGNRIDVIIDVQERWYIWPSPIFEHGERNLSAFLKEPQWNKLNYGMWLKWNNFRGRNELLNAKIRLGYKEQYVLQYEKPNLGVKENHKIFVSYSHSRQHRVSYLTRDNRPVYFRDDDRYSLGLTDAFVAYSYRPQLYSQHNFRAHFINDWVSDTVAALNPGYFGEGITRHKYIKVDYVFRYDIRDSRIYPLEGEAFKFKILRNGLGIFREFPYGNLEVEAALFYHKKLAERLYFANVAKGKLATNKDLPIVFQQQAFGYEVNMTGYDDFVIDGTDYFINKVIFKYQLVKPGSVTFRFFNMGQFNRVHYAVYINLFGDIGYVNSLYYTDPSNFMANSLQYSTGLGIDLVTYYDKVLSIEYAVNRYGMTGFFFRVTTPFLDW